MTGFVAGLAARWRQEAALLRHRGAEPQAVALESCAAELETEAERHASELLPIGDAAAESGYSEERLRELVREARVPAQRSGRELRIRRADLPRRPPGARSRSEIDLESVAQRLWPARG